MEKITKVGVGVLIFDKEQKLLLGLRKSAHGKGTWCPPGGHLEYGESFEDAAIRETKEETNIDLKVDDLQVVGVTNDFFEESGKHYVTVMLKTSNFCGNPVVMEVEKCDQWCWFEKDALPEKLFLPIKNFLKKYRL